MPTDIMQQASMFGDKEATVIQGAEDIDIPKQWQDLSIKEKADRIKVGVKNGLTNMSDIRKKYNEFAMGGDKNYNSWKKRLKNRMHINVDSDNTYDYEGYYNSNPEEAWKIANGDPEGHFPDDYKTVYHPTFSNYSIYDAKYHPKYNPQALHGGRWEGNKYIVHRDQYHGPVDFDERLNYLQVAENNGVSLREADGTWPEFDGIPLAGVLPNVTVTGQLGGKHVEKPDAIRVHGEGGNLYAPGGRKRTPQYGNNNAQLAMQFFINKGLAPHQAAGLVGNLMRESGLNPGAVNPSSKAYGIAQWLGSRRSNLFARYGSNPTLQQQLEYVWHELNTTNKKGLTTLRASRNASEAAQNAFGYYEFSAGPEGAIAAMNKSNQNGLASMNKGIQFASQLIGQPAQLYQQQNNGMVRGYIYDILPKLYAMDGVNTVVYSGRRPNAVVYKNGKPTGKISDHARDLAADLGPGKGSTFADMLRVLNDPNSHVARWMKANNVDYIDETSATGTTKYWHDHNRDHSHFHHRYRPEDGSPLILFDPMFFQNTQSAQSTSPLPEFQPSNPEAFYGQNTNSAISNEMLEKMTNMEATIKAYQEAQQQQQLAAAKQAEMQEKAARANLAWNFVLGMNVDNQQQSPYMGILGALAGNSLTQEI